MEFQTSADPAVLWHRARQFCCVGGHAPESGEIIGILQKLKDDMSAHLADSQKADEEDRKSDHATLVQAKENEVATLTATIEPNLQQGDLGVEVDRVEGDLAETENLFYGGRGVVGVGGAPEEQSRRTQEQIVAEVVSPQPMRRVFVAVRQHGWMCTQKGLWLACESAGNSTGVRADSPTAMVWFYLLNSLMSSLPIVETQKSRWNVSGVNRRETSFFSRKTTSLTGVLVFPARCAHRPGNELNID